MGVVSNFYIRDWPIDLLDCFGLSSYLDFVLDSAACGWRKPGQQIYELACERARVTEADRGRILFIGDHLLNDVLAPQRLGMQGLYFDRSQERPTSTLSPPEVRSITTWNQFRADLLN